MSSVAGVPIRSSGSSSGSLFDSKDQFISICRENFDFNQSSSEIIKKLSLEERQYFYKCDDAINNLLSVDSIIFYLSIIIPILCFLYFIRVGQKHYKIAEEKIKNAKNPIIYARKPENNPSNSMEAAVLIGAVCSVLLFLIIYMVHFFVVELMY
ncbi:hypothetical protein [Acinetobacter vivianii]|uniref:hypothetical protein n=1 Tax=Acinetobacter vivianii TaxID=1776742 RepID=UPI0040428E84